jgi:hypothetical protein
MHGATVRSRVKHQKRSGPTPDVSPKTYPTG